MDLAISGKTALVTGGSSGIGKSVVRVLAKEGCRVIFTYFQNEQAARDLASDINVDGGFAEYIQMDIRDFCSIESAVADLLQRVSIDILVNNAVSWGNQQAQGNLSHWQHQLRSNLESHYQISQSVLPAMIAKQWGRIVNISSNLALDGMPGSAAYSAAKAGLHGMTNGMAWDGGKENVLVNVVMPGLTLTERASKLIPQKARDGECNKTPTGKLSKPEDIAMTVAFLCSARNGNITGEAIRVSGGR